MGKKTNLSLNLKVLINNMYKLLINNIKNKKIQKQYNLYESIKNGYKIPNLIHMTFYNRNLPIEIHNIIHQNKRMCSGCIFRFYDDNDCKNIIKNHFNERIYNAYLNINDNYGAMKADFFRYCILYLFGGIYIDIKSSFLYPIFKIIQKNDTCILDYPRNNYESWRCNAPTFEQWVLMFAPNHPYLESMILQMVNYIETKYQPQINGRTELNTKEKILHVTGPDAFTIAIKNTGSNNTDFKVLHRNIDYNKYFKINSGISYRDMYKINGRKHYSDLNEPLYK
jgi:mannosyltransferase OCH1-like enzyme